MLRCVRCGAALEVLELRPPSGRRDLGPNGSLRCMGCGEEYPVVSGTARMLPSELQTEAREISPGSADTLKDSREGSPRDGEADAKRRTAESFAFEWERFGERRAEWRKNFLDYMQPHQPDYFRDRLVLDVGAGSGRHSAEAAEFGARVVAVDLGRSIDVARRNLPSEVLTVQADAELLPFEDGAFDLVMSIGVLHHVPHTERALRSIARYARPGGEVRVYLYWVPERRWHRVVLRFVTAARRVTVRLPHHVLHALCYPLAVCLFAFVVIPYRILRRRRRGRRLADALPLKTYADYPFSVCVNDQFDRFSAPLERRFTADEVQDMLRSAGLTEVSVLPNHGWIGIGRQPAV